MILLHSVPLVRPMPCSFLFKFHGFAGISSVFWLLSSISRFSVEDTLVCSWFYSELTFYNVNCGLFEVFSTKCWFWVLFPELGFVTIDSSFFSFSLLAILKAVVLLVAKNLWHCVLRFSCPYMSDFCGVFSWFCNYLCFYIMVVADTSVSSSSSSTCVSDPSNHLHLSSSNVSRISLVSNPFSGTGFGGWWRSKIVSLSAKNKIAFIDGSCPRPADDSPQIKLWDRCNIMVISWMTSSLSPEIAESVQYSETAQSIWNKLYKRYGSVGGTKVFKLKKELAFTNQGSLDIDISIS